MTTTQHATGAEHSCSVLSSDELAQISGGAVSLAAFVDGYCGTPWPLRFPFPRPPIPPVDPWAVRIPTVRF